MGDGNFFDESLLVELHAVDTGDTMIGVGLAQGATVIDDVPLVVACANHRVMACTSGHLRVLLQNLPNALERSQRRVGDGIAHAIIGTTPPSFASHEIILAPSLQHERPLDVALWRHLLVGGAIGEGDDAQQVVG